MRRDYRRPERGITSDSLDCHSVTQALTRGRQIPAFAGMTVFRAPIRGIVIPAKAGIHRHCLNRRLLFPRPAPMC